MSFLDTLIGLIAPHYCLSCGCQDALLCQGCASSIVGIPERCYRCHKLSDGYRTCKSCRSSSFLYAVLAAKPYDTVPKMLVGSLKFNGAQAAAADMARDMAAVLGIHDAMYVVPVPTTTDRVRYRGYDQAVLLAKRLAALTGQRYDYALRRQGRKHQVGASRHIRLQQLKEAFYVPNPSAIRGKHILLVDDVCTTGATLEAAARVLHAAGAARISAIVYAQA